MPFLRSGLTVPGFRVRTQGAAGNFSPVLLVRAFKTATLCFGFESTGFGVSELGRLCRKPHQPRTIWDHSMGWGCRF